MLATGVTVTVRDFVRLACQVADIDVAFQGSGESEIGVDVSTGKPVVRVNPAFYRPAEVDLAGGRREQSGTGLDWQANTSLQALCRIMMETDLQRQGG